uniref:B box-type domain-containing protein n=1 Tax=Romanomermis culicivorax TaxID=13658 RepID=A0A915JI15_ROMCU
ITELFNYFRCRLCRAINKFTDVRLGDFIHSSLVNIFKLMSDVSKHDIMCSSCRNTRIFINPEDFYECRTCLLTLCSLCSLSNFHRTHDIISLTLRGTARLCKMFKTIYATEREIEALLSRKKEFDKNHLTTKKSILRTCHLKLKSSSVGLRSWIPLFEEDILRLESVLVKCAHIYNEEMEKRFDDLIEKLSKQLYENSKVYDETWKQLDGKLDAVLELVDVRLPVLLAGKEVNLKY